MVDVHSEIIQFRGSHYEFGFMQGEKLRDSNLLNARIRMFSKKNTHRYTVDVDHYLQIMKQVAPKILEEIHGLKDALGMDLENAIKHFGGYYMEYGRSGCSIFMDETYMVRNYDNSPESYEGRFMFYAPNDGGYATVGPTMQITGRTDGMNEKGLVMGYNFVNRLRSNDGFMCNMIGRIILENCANVPEAIDLLKKIPHRYSFSYVLTDPNHVGVIVEASSQNVVVRYDNVCTNHFDVLTSENRNRMDDSLRRAQVMKDAVKNKLTPFEAYKIMNDMERGVFSTNYGAWSGTLHTTLLDPTSLKIDFAIGGNRMPFIFDFGKWVTGVNIHVKRINGQLQSNMKFIGM